MVLTLSLNDPDPFDLQFGPCFSGIKVPNNEGSDSVKAQLTFVARADASKIWSAEGLTLVRMLDFIFQTTKNSQNRAEPAWGVRPELRKATGGVEAFMVMIRTWL